MIRLVMLGDIVGVPGRRAAIQSLPTIRQRWNPVLVLANAENIANGSGITPKDYHRLIDAGFGGLTLGDHVFRKKQIVNTLDSQSNIIRPANLSRKAAGKGMMRLEAKAEKTENAGNAGNVESVENADRPGSAASAAVSDGSQQPGKAEIEANHAHADQQGGVVVYVITVLSRLFMASMPAGDPFACVDSLLETVRRRDPTAVVIVEVHGETTSEKQAMGWYLNGRVSAVLGTHTHVPTADARILPAQIHGSGGETGPPALPGTAYISDLGMTGPIDSVLGRRVDRVVKNMTTNMPAPFDVAEGSPTTAGVTLTIDPNSARATRIEPFSIPADLDQPPFTS